MNKKIAIVVFISLFMLVACSFAVLAQGAKFTEALQDMGKFLFEDLPTMGHYGFKFLLWITLFALMNYGLTRKDIFDKKTAGIISLVISLASVLLIPGSMVEHIFKIYGTIIVLGLGVFVPLILFWIIHSNFSGDTVGEHVIRAAAYFIIGYALITFASYADTFMGSVG